MIQAFKDRGTYAGTPARSSDVKIPHSEPVDKVEALSQRYAEQYHDADTFFESVYCGVTHDSAESTYFGEIDDTDNHSVHYDHELTILDDSHDADVLEVQRTDHQTPGITRQPHPLSSVASRSQLLRIIQAFC